MASRCPDRDRLDAHAAGRLPPAEAAEIERHLAECAECRWRLQGLDDESLTARLRGALGWDDEEDLRRRLQGRVAGDYEVLGAIGRGAAGIVFQARDVRLDRLVAIKCPADARQCGRLVAMFKEAQILARVSHPNVAGIYALSEAPDPPYMAMEFVDGLPIDEALAGQPLAQKLAVFRQVLAGVAELHHRGIVHRDLKPGNILVDRRGAAKVLDMGIAEQVAAGSPATETPSSACGTPAYLAPEQSRGAPPRPSADVFSLGIVLFEILTGQRPFAGEHPEDVIRAIREADPPLPRALQAEIPGPLQAITLAALEKDPTRRYPTARHFLLDLERFLDGEAVTANPTLLQDVLDHGIEKHVGDLGRWQADRLISGREYDDLAARYARLREREAFWVLDSRRISFSQVALHLGAWSCVVASFLMVCFEWATLSDAARVLFPLVVFAALLGLGLHLWGRRTHRVAVVLLMAACLTWPLCVATFFCTAKWHWGARPTDYPLDLTSAELIVVTGTVSLLALALWWRTRTSAFALIWGLSAVALATALFMWAGMRGWHADEKAVWYLVPGAALFLVAISLDLRWRQVHFAAPLYIMGMLVLLVALTVLAEEGRTTRWLGIEALAGQWGALPLDHARQIRYSFILNGAAYLALGLMADRATTSGSLRRIATVLYWLSPTHLLLPIRLLADQWAILPDGWTVPEIVLPVGALAFVFASVPKQMKAFFFSGLAYVAVAAEHLTAAHFKEVFAWPVGLAVAGLVLAMVAWKKPTMFDRKPTLPGASR